MILAFPPENTYNDILQYFTILSIQMSVDRFNHDISKNERFHHVYKHETFVDSVRSSALEKYLLFSPLYLIFEYL